MQDLINLRSFLEVDRVSICQFQPGDKGQVIAESIQHGRLPSLMLASFPVEALLPHSRELLLEFRIGAMVNVARKTVFRIPPSNLDLDLDLAQVETMTSLADNSHVIRHLTEMGVAFYLVMPIFHREAAWGLLMVHHSEASFISTRKLEVLRTVANQLSATAAEEALHIQSQIKAQQQAVSKQIAKLLQSSSAPDFQTALENTVAAFQGSGGRLCMKNQSSASSHRPPKDFTDCLEASSQDIRTYTCGLQPAIPTKTDSQLMACYRLWQDNYASSNYQIWAVSNLYRTPELQTLVEAFQSTQIHGLLLVPLVHQQQFLGYLNIFRNAAASNAFRLRPIGDRRLELGSEWNNLDLAQTLAQTFAKAIYEHELSQQLHDSNLPLNTERQQQEAQLQQVVQQQKSISEVLAIIQAATDSETIFRSTTKELCNLLQSERVAVYQFNADWGGRFIHDYEYVNPKWRRTSKLGRNTAWNDTYLQDTQGGRYRFNETFVVDNIYDAELSSCHLEILEQFQIKAFATAPIFVGKRLWGVLAAYQHSQPRCWTATEVLFLTQTATALGLALQQAELLAQSQKPIAPFQSLPKELGLDERSLPSN